MPGVDDAAPLANGAAAGVNGGRSEGAPEGIAGALRSVRRALWVSGATWLSDPAEARGWASLALTSLTAAAGRDPDADARDLRAWAAIQPRLERIREAADEALPAAWGDLRAALGRWDPVHAGDRRGADGARSDRGDGGAAASRPTSEAAPASGPTSGGDDAGGPAGGDDAGATPPARGEPGSVSAAMPRARAESTASSAPSALSAGLRPDALLSDLGVDEELADRLDALQISVVYDLLAARPISERAVQPVHGAGRPLPEGEVAVGGRVRARVTILRPDGTAESRVRIMGADAQWIRWHRKFTAADLLRLQSDAQRRDPKVVLVGEALAGGEVVGHAIASAVHGAAWVLRHAAADADQDAIDEAWARVGPLLPSLDEVLPEGVAARAKLPALAPTALSLLERGAQGEEARRRMAFDELLILQLGLSASRFLVAAAGGATSGPRPAGERRRWEALPQRALVDSVLRGDSAPLANGAQVAWEDVKRDLMGPTPMRRVVVGPADAAVDEVALAAILVALEARTQVWVVCPEHQSALVQHTLWASRVRGVGATAGGAGAGTVCLSADPREGQAELRRADRDAVRKGEVGVVFSTPALMDPATPGGPLEWRRLGLIVVFEQANYGATLARAASWRTGRSEGGGDVDVLGVSRAPVPMERLWDAWASWDLSWVPSPTNSPPARGTVWREGERDRVWDVLGEAVRAGRSVVLGFPLTRASTDLLDRRESAALLDTLRREVFPGVDIALFHGDATDAERLAALDAFACRRARVLVATTMVELSGPMPRGVIALLEHADRTDVQRLMAWRAWVGGEGHVHYVDGETPRVWGARAVELLAEQAPDAAVIEATPLAAPCAARAVEADDEAGTAARSTRWVDRGADLDLAVRARRLAHDLLRQGALSRPRTDGAVDARDDAGPVARLAALAWHRWSGLGESNPLPAPKSAGPRRRRRRRKKKDAPR